MKRNPEPDWGTCTEGELWEYVASHLAERGIDTCLVGGAVVSIYSEGAYRSGDLDLVLLSYLNDKLPEAMRELGFEVVESRHYSHQKCKHLFMLASASIRLCSSRASIRSIVTSSGSGVPAKVRPRHGMSFRSG